MIVPLQPIASQTAKVILGGQNCQLNLTQKPQGIFVDVLVNGAPIVSAVIARDMAPIVCRKYTGFIGNLLFIDTQGGDQPEYTGLNSRFKLLYLSDSEYAIL